MRLIEDGVWVRGYTFFSVWFRMWYGLEVDDW